MVQLSSFVSPTNKNYTYCGLMTDLGLTEEPIVVGRMEKDVDKLEHLYEEGFRLGEQFVKEHLPHLL